MLVSDYIQPTPGGGRCWIRIYEQSGELPVVLCTALPDNPGQSITNAAEQIACMVLDVDPVLCDPFSIGSLPGVEYDKPFLYVEHYLDGARGTPEDPATFALVTFSHYQPREVLRSGQWVREIGEPRWSDLDRATVEVLIGERL